MFKAARRRMSITAADVPCACSCCLRYVQGAVLAVLDAPVAKDKARQGVRGSAGDIVVHDALSETAGAGAFCVHPDHAAPVEQLFGFAAHLPRPGPPRSATKL